MRVYISVDMEGMPGIFSNDQTDPKGDRYDEGRQIMTDISIFVSQELHRNGVEEILIADSHDGMGNILYEKLPEYVSLMRGSRRPINMVFGIDRGFDAAVFLGYHAAAGSLHASFDHTYSGSKF
ncbi:MAG: M55 family metallopeptidase, partial [Candidatus Parvarchaeota archaeon]